ncbi:PREDICTED: uncharacterized protein LOC109463604 [Branchiostoma belcheri]|uniref:Uncharacterized protein LOC109463604 n=1 Tax=Branchiostoma belcheri TaxID=7741 RepID=A0A6P4YB46_BRABE|nr:PREDICTED: uncharacterized protein LOC109463604 [Branchiostoma belcheri]
MRYKTVLECCEGWILVGDTCTDQTTCGFVRCPSTPIHLSLPEDRNYILVDFRDYITAADADLNRLPPMIDSVTSTNAAYPITKYEVSSNTEARGGRYLFPSVRFRACHDVCDVSVVIKDETAPRAMSCPGVSHVLQGKSCRNVHLYDYFNSSTIASWFRDNVEVTDVMCRQSTIQDIVTGETTAVACQAKDRAGNPSAACHITFLCMDNDT